MSRFEIRKDFESENPFLGGKCSPWYCDCGLISCGIREDGVVDVDDTEEDAINMDDVADQ